MMAINGRGFWAIIVFIGLDCAGLWAGSEDIQRAIIAEYRAEEGDVVFYGKVVDQEGSPVVGAEVDVNVPTAYEWGPLVQRRRKLFTGEDGRFEVSSGTYGVDRLMGRTLYVERIEKAGYAGDWIRDEHSSFSFATDSEQRFLAVWSEPILYELRRKGEGTIVLRDAIWQLRIGVQSGGNCRGYDFIERSPIRDLKHPVLNDVELTCDLQVLATWNTNSATWSVILSPGGTNGGILVSDKLLYEAPAEGYKPEYSFVPENGEPVRPMCVYLKSRDPAIYTRLVVNYLNANEDFFRLSAEAVTNPYGERNLERATDLPFDVAHRLIEEARAAFRESRRPTKPDLEALVREAKEKGGE